MTASPCAATWPTTAAALRELLDMDACHSMTCHGTLKKNKDQRCKNKINNEDCDTAARRLNQIVECGSFKAAQSFLQELAPLIMCKNKGTGHQEKFSGDRLSKWEATLGSVPCPSVEEEEDTSSDEETKNKTSSSASQQVVKAKKEASTQQDTSHTPSPKTTKIVHKFEPYSITRSTTFINKKIKALLLRPLQDWEKKIGGYIYTYTFPESYHHASPFIKIGFAQNVQGRMARWKAQCSYTPRVLVQQSADHYVKIEKLVHAQLVNTRKREAGGCPTCGVEHNEWFGASELDISRAMSLWTSWMRQMPYDEEGRLKGKWRARIECLDMDDAACWEELVNAVYVDDESEAEEEEEDEFQWSTDDESHHSAEEYETYESEDEYDDK